MGARAVRGGGGRGGAVKQRTAPPLGGLSIRGPSRGPRCRGALKEGLKGSLGVDDHARRCHGECGAGGPCGGGPTPAGGRASPPPPARPSRGGGPRHAPHATTSTPLGGGWWEKGTAPPLSPHLWYSFFLTSPPPSPVLARPRPSSMPMAPPPDVARSIPLPPPPFPFASGSLSSVKTGRHRGWPAAPLTGWGPERAPTAVALGCARAGAPATALPRPAWHGIPGVVAAALFPTDPPVGAATPTAAQTRGGGSEPRRGCARDATRGALEKK